MAKQRFKAPNYGTKVGIPHHIFSYNTGKKDKGKSIRENLIFDNGVYETEDPKKIKALMEAGYLPAVLSEEELGEAKSDKGFVEKLVDDARSLTGPAKRTFMKALGKLGFGSKEEDVPSEEEMEEETTA